MGGRGARERGGDGGEGKSEIIERRKRRKKRDRGVTNYHYIHFPAYFFRKKTINVNSGLVEVRI